jgi:Fe-S-cluster-containing dehydrogenase component
MMHKVIACDPDKCTGCEECELACSAIKEKALNPRLSRIRVVKIEPTIDMALTCYFCEKPPCITSCPRKALRQAEKTGIILVDEAKCTGCGWCINACEFGALLLHPDKKVVVVCDLCGGDPLCINLCTLKALELTTFEALSEKARKSATKRLFVDKTAP